MSTRGGRGKPRNWLPRPFPQPHEAFSPHRTARPPEGCQGVHGHLEVAGFGAARATHPRQAADQTPSGCREDTIPAMELCPGLHPLSAQAIRLMSFIAEPGPIRKMPPHLGEPLEPPPISPARGPPTDWGELVQVHEHRDVFQSSARRAARDRHPQPLTAAGSQVTTNPRGGRTRRALRADTRKTSLQGRKRPIQGAAFRAGSASGGGSEPLIRRATLVELGLTELSLPFHAPSRAFPAAADRRLARGVGGCPR